MSDVAQLGLAVDSSQVTGASAALNNMAGAANKATTAATDLEKAAARAGVSVGTLRSMADRSNVSFDEMADRIKAQRSGYSDLSAAQTKYVSVAQQVQATNSRIATAANDNAQSLGKMQGASDNTSSSFDRLASTITRRFIAALIVREVAEFVRYLWQLNAALAAVYSTAQLAGVGLQQFQGLQTAAGYAGISGDTFSKAMVEFNKQVDLARHGIGDLKTLLDQNGMSVGDTATTFQRVANLVASTADGARKLSILQQAGLPATREFADLMSRGAVSINAAADASTKLTDQQLAQAKQVNDAWNKFWTDFSDRAKQVFVGILDAVRNSAGGDTQQRLYVGATPTTVSGPAPVDPAILKQQIALEQQRLGLLGQTATVEQQVRAVELQINTARLDNVHITAEEEQKIISLTRAQALGTFQINAQTDAERVRLQALKLGGTAGEEYAIVQTKINEAVAKGAPLTAEQIQLLTAAAHAFVAAKQQADQYATILDLLKSSGASFATDLVTGLGQGKSLMDSLGASARNLSQTLTSTAFTQLFQGNFLTAGLAGIGALISGLFGANQQQKQQHAADVAAWNTDVTAYNAWIDTMNGKGPGGSLADSFNAMISQFNQFAQAAAKAGDQASIARAAAASIAFQISSSQKFLATWQAVVQGFSDGLGPDSPFLTAANDIGDALSKVQSYINDTRTALNIRAGSSDFGQSANLASAQAQADIAANINKVTAASQTYLLSLLQTPPVLSDLDKGILQIQGKAAALQGALVQLGMSSDEAAKAIGEGVAQAVAQLQASISGAAFKDLISRFNEAVGKSYINSLQSLIEQHQKDLVSGAPLDLVNQVFQAEAQKIVNDAGLVGDSFADMIKWFPQLADVVTQATAVVTQSTEAIDAATKTAADSFNSLIDRFNNAAGLGYLTQERAIIAQHQTDLSSGAPPDLVNQVFTIESQKIINDAQLTGAAFDQFIAWFPQLAGVVHQSYEGLQADAAAIQKSMSAAQDYIKGVSKQIQDYLNSLKTGSNSILSPQDRLTAAQGLFNQQFGLAQGGNKDALDNITQTAQTLLDLAKSFYASSTGYVNIFTDTTTKLGTLTNIAASTVIAANPGAFAKGGIIPGFAGGGIIGNGLFGVDSVMARYEGGGSVALAGGEYVMPAAQTASNLPALNAMRAGRSASNDNSQGFATVAGVTAKSANAIIAALREEMQGLREEVRRDKDAARRRDQAPRVPGTNKRTA